MEQPQLIAGRLSVDDRGEVGFVNDFNFAGVKRFYSVTNHRAGFVRAWHGHLREAKYITAVEGEMLVCCLAQQDWDKPPESAKIHRFTLSSKTPSILYIPAGYANGLMSLSENAKVIIFSTSTVEESQADDVRFPARKWDPWSVEER